MVRKGSIMVLIGCYWLLTPIAANAAPSLSFVGITQETPLRLAPPQTKGTMGRLGLRIRGLPQNQQVELVVIQYRDENNNDAFEAEEQKELLRLTTKDLASEKQLIIRNGWVLVLPKGFGKGADLLEAKLHEPDGTLLSTPSQLTLRRASGKRFGLFALLSDISQKAFQRLVSIYDVVRDDEKNQQSIYVQDLQSGTPIGAMRSLKLEAMPVSQLTLSPDGTRVAWVSHRRGRFELKVADVGSSNPRVVLSEDQVIVDILFFDPSQIVVALKETILLLNVNKEGVQSYRLPVHSIRKLYHARSMIEGFEVTLSAEVGESEGLVKQSPFLVQILPSQESILLRRLSAHELYSAIPFTHAKGTFYFRFHDGNHEYVRYMDLRDETEHEVATCRQVGSLSLASGGSRLAWSGSRCGREP